MDKKHPIAAGGFGCIYKGKIRSLDIVKKEMLKFSEDDFFKELNLTHFYRSIRTPAVLGITEEDHINIGGAAFQKSEIKSSMVLEMVKGKTLKEELKDVNKTNYKEMKNQLRNVVFALEISKGIEYFHERNLVHRDLKPDNILITNFFDAKIIDFGISKELIQTTDITLNEKGTMQYEPPENVVNDINEVYTDPEGTQTNMNATRKVSLAFDIWSLGLIFNEIFGLELPWEGKNGKKILVELLSRVDYKISKNIEDLDIVYLIENCTKVFPRERIDIKSIINLLYNILVKKLKEASLLGNGIYNLYGNRKKVS